MNLPDEIIEKMKAYPAFHQKVWMACAAIPAGETRTYGQLARAIGHPKASRAVGAALAANPFIPIVPCHRVIRSDGGLGGYAGAGGIEGKARLLAAEKAKFPLKATQKEPHI